MKYDQWAMEYVLRHAGRFVFLRLPDREGIVLSVVQIGIQHIALLRKGQVFHRLLDARGQFIGGFNMRKGRLPAKDMMHIQSVEHLEQMTLKQASNYLYAKGRYYDDDRTTEVT